MNCQLYSGWREGKRKPGIGPCGEGLVEAAGESIEVRGARADGGVGVSDGEGYGASVIDFGELTTLRLEVALYTQVPPRTLILVTHTCESHDLMTQASHSVKPIS